MLMGDVRDAMSDIVDHRSLEQLALDTQNLKKKRTRGKLKPSGILASTPR